MVETLQGIMERQDTRWPVGNVVLIRTALVSSGLTSLLEITLTGPVSKLNLW